jgi:hypothetical protein
MINKKLHQYYLTICGFLLFGITLSHAQDFYKWIDKNGTTHYTVTQPPTSAKKIDTVTTYGEKINSENIPQKSRNTDESKTIGDTFTIGTTNGFLEIPPLKDGESITFNK